MCKNQDDDYNKYDENRPFEEEIEEEFSKPIGKFEDFYFNKPWRVILYTFIASLVLFFVSWLIRNEGGIIVVFTYPVSLPFYGSTLHDKKKQLEFRGVYLGPVLVIILWLLPFLCFIVRLIAPVS